MIASQGGAKAMKLGNFANRSLRSAYNNLSTASNSNPSGASTEEGYFPRSTSADSYYFTASTAPRASDGLSYFSAASPPNVGPTSVAVIQDLSAHYQSHDKAHHKHERAHNSTGNGRTRLDYATRIAASQIHLASVNIQLPTRSADEEDEVSRKKARPSISKRRHSFDSTPKKPTAFFNSTSNIVKNTSDSSPKKTTQDDSRLLYRRHFQKAARNTQRPKNASVRTPSIFSAPLLDTSRIDLPSFFGRPIAIGSRSLTTQSAVEPVSDVSALSNAPSAKAESAQESSAEIEHISEQAESATENTKATSPVKTATRRQRPRAASSPPSLSSLATPADAELVQPYIDAMRNALQSENLEEMQLAVKEYRKAQLYSIQAHNMALYITAKFRKQDSVSPVMDIFEETLTHPSLAPTMTTYGIVIEALAQRDAEVQRRIANLRGRLPLRYRARDALAPRLATPATLAQLKSLKDEWDSAAVLQMYRALGRRGGFLPITTFLALLRRCVARRRPAIGMEVFSNYETAQPTAQPLHQTYALLIDLYGGGDKERRQSDRERVEQAGKVFAAYRDLVRNGSFDRAGTAAPAMEEPANIGELVWISMMKVYFSVKDAASAVGLFEEMLAGQSMVTFESLATVILGVQSCDGSETAGRWFKRVQELPPYLEASQSQKQNLASLLIQQDLSRPLTFANIEYALEMAETSVASGTAITAQTTHLIASKAIALASSDLSEDDQGKVGPLLQRVLAIWKASADGQGATLLPALRDLVSALATHGLAKDAIGIVMAASKHLNPSTLSAAQLQDLAEAIDSISSSPELTSNQALSLFQLIESVVGHQEAALSPAISSLIPSIPLELLSEGQLGLVLRSLCILRQDGDKEEAGLKLAKFLSDLKQHLNGRHLPVDEGDLQTYSLAFQGAASLISRDTAQTYFENVFGSKAQTLFDIKRIQPDSPVESAQSVTSEPDSGKAALSEDDISTRESISTDPTSIHTDVRMDPAVMNYTIDDPHDQLPDRPLSPIAPYAEQQWQQVVAKPMPQWDHALSQYIQGLTLTKAASNQSPAVRTDIINQLRTAAKEGRMIAPVDVCSVIEYLSHLGQPEMVEELYLMGYDSLRLLANDPHEQFECWKMLEDSMLVAMAHFGKLDRVGLHRDRLLAAGTTPSANAYGAMILNAQDTTDDATVAIELFQESRRLGVIPNTYLFNNLISRLSKARRTKAVLECFEQMKLAGVPTSSVTYGAVINACCKVGDEDSAVYLFEEMRNLVDFVPKVPPFNTMIQFFVSTRPNRERALHYYAKMLEARVKPSAHTYRLLLDCHGQIEPIDEPAMRAVFEKLLADRDVAVQGVHWASMIYSYGTSQRDFAAAQATFDEIAKDDSSKPSKQRMEKLPDAICYEAILNVCVAHDKSEAVEEYHQAMRASGIASTAYIENARIKAFAQTGNIEAARSVFEELSDPPSGVAAPGNHPEGRHKSRGLNKARSTDGHVYREPANYEVMIRVEMANGHKDRASRIVELAEMRAFPQPVIDRMRMLLSPVAATLEAEFSR